MSTVLIVVHLMIVVALVGVVLLQRSEGGALGIGGGGGGGLMSGRGAADLLTRTTGFLAAAFFITSITLTVLARQQAVPTSAVQPIGSPAQTLPVDGGEATSGGVFDALKQTGTESSNSTQVPVSE